MVERTPPWVISLLSALFGAVVGGLVTQVREIWKERQQAQRIRSVLIAEALPIADVVTVCGSFANLVSSSDASTLKTAMFVTQLPPEPVVFKSLSSQLPLLSQKEASAVLAFYGSLEMARRQSLQFSTQEDYPHDHGKVMASYWRSTARNACTLMDLFKDAISKNATAPDTHFIEGLKRDLIQVTSMQSPRVAQSEGQFFILARKPFDPDTRGQI